jgi:hypothetical protein
VDHQMAAVKYILLRTVYSFLREHWTEGVWHDVQHRLCHFRNVQCARAVTA